MNFSILPISPRWAELRWIKGRIATLFLVILGAIGVEARTITVGNVVYTVTNEQSKQVKVGAQNGSLLSSAQISITIPATISDPTDGSEFRVTMIDASAFKGTAVTGVNIEASLDIIPEFAFQGCKQLTAVTLPAGLRSINRYAFEGCTSLAAPAFPSSLQMIDGNAFRHCTSLGDVALPANVTFGASAFQGSYITRLLWPETSGDITISESCFQAVSGLTSITIPSYVKTLESDCFKGCADLEQVDLSASATGDFQINNEAFLNCVKLREVRFPKRMNQIGHRAFSGCALETLIMPYAKQLGDEVFASNKQLKVITKTSWPGEKMVIGKSLFAQSGLTKIEFPDWMVEVPEKICYTCSMLREVELPEAVLAIKPDAFRNNGELQSITFPSTLKTIESSVFQDCGQLTALQLPNSLEAIGNQAFYNCKSVSELVLPESVVKIGDMAFALNSNVTAPKLVRIELPNRENAEWRGIQFGRMVFQYQRTLKSFDFPAWLTVVPDGFFSNCDQLQTVAFAPGTQEVGEYAFSNDLRLQVETFPESIEKYGKGSFMNAGRSLPTSSYLGKLIIGNGLVIEDRAFDYAKLESVEIEDCSATLGKDVVGHQTSAKSISFPDCMTEIPAGICNGWSQLESVRWPERVERIGAEAFRDCSKLNFGRDANGAGNVLDFSQAPFSECKTYGAGAFHGTKITAIIWPESGEGIFIGENLFNSVTTLTRVHIPGWMDEIPTGLFANCSGLTEVIWDASERTHLTIKNDSFRATGIKVISWPNVSTTIQDYAFAICSKATKIEWPESPATLSGIWIFYNCSKLSEPTTVPEYVTTIPNNTFQYCTSLKEMTLHSGVTTIGDNAFQNCTSLERLIIEGNVRVLNGRICMDCKNLKELTVKQPLEQIGIRAFYNCRQLSQVNFAYDHTHKLSSIKEDAFRNCESLIEFPDVLGPKTEVAYSWNQFSSDAHLKHLTLPGYLRCVNSGTDIVTQGCVGLQSVTLLQHPNSPLALASDEFKDSPLLGVSYYDGTPEQFHGVEYDGVKEREHRGIMLVNRDMKWRLAEAGLNKIWDIHEIRNPQPNLVGELTSQFTPGDLTNKYTATIRWDIVESDLNPNGTTVYHLKRDGKEIVRVEIGQREDVGTVNDGNIQQNSPAAKYDVTLWRAGSNEPEQMPAQQIDFIQEISENTYKMTYANQQTALYYHPSTSHRLGLNEVNGAISWFIYKDEFESPDLNGYGIPDHYTYTVSIDGYDYDEAVNNEDYALGDNGLAWHYERKRFDGAESKPCVVHASMAVPSLSFDGIYTKDEIASDLAGQLAESDSFMDNGNVKLEYEFANTNHIKHKLVENNSINPIIDHITSYAIPSRENPQGSEWESIVIQGDEQRGSGTMLVPEDKALQGCSFQMVTVTKGRGTFGSRIVTIPHTPKLALEIDPIEQLHWQANHAHGSVQRVRVHLYPELNGMGYDSLPTENQYGVGVWRQLDYGTNKPIGRSDTTGEETASGNEAETLGHHMGTNYAEHSWTCSQCAADQGYKADSEGNWTYTDHIDSNLSNNQQRDISTKYRVRLYVQLPDDSDKYMIAEATASKGAIATSLNQIDATEQANGGTIYYNLQGQRIKEPERGQIVIRIDSKGACKLRIE